jgi:hypothetical protein
LTPIVMVSSFGLACGPSSMATPGACQDFCVRVIG